MTPRVGDVVTEEPPDGSIVRDTKGDLWSRHGDRWLFRRDNGTCARETWGELCEREYGCTLRVVYVPDDDWETIARDDVRVGDEIEMSYRGAVTGWALERGERCFTFEGSTRRFRTAPGMVIRRRVRSVMPEPAAPAVVRHAGRVLVRPVGSTVSSWWPIEDPAASWFTWSEVLALDPGKDPVVIDLEGAP